ATVAVAYQLSHSVTQPTMDEDDDDEAHRESECLGRVQQEVSVRLLPNESHLQPEIGSPQSPDFSRFEATRLSIDSPDAQVATAGPVTRGRVAKPATISRNRLYPVLREVAVTGIVDDEKTAQPTAS
ncbi:hypothetical protein V498_09961, partial [Pseudogymnoascus sp. VKM F-4517 (FW-2822)]